MMMAVTLVGGAMLAGYLFVQITKPKHYFRVLTASGGEIPIRMKSLGESFTWVDPKDSRAITWPLDQSFARRTPKGGLRYAGDARTGALVDFNGMGPNGEANWNYMDPKFIAAFHLDGRIRQIAQSIKGDKWDKLDKYVMPALIVIGLILAVVGFWVYKMYSASHAG